MCTETFVCAMYWSLYLFVISYDSWNNCNLCYFYLKMKDRKLTEIKQLSQSQIGSN